ncbi:MAG: hypothetical protein O9302_03395 [Cyclobacteriaceae bacterium]|nr:hypothetical protein [Cytophagales bacterium]MCZ8327082.1 hypothetical protein [Cyclobacteriaceae bacterium]
MCQCKKNLNGCGCGCNTCNKTTKKKKVNKPDQSNQANFIQQKSLVTNDNRGYTKKSEEFTTTSTMLTKRKEILEPEVEVIPNEETTKSNTKDFTLLAGIGLMLAGAIINKLRS